MLKIQILRLLSLNKDKFEQDTGLRDEFVKWLIEEMDGENRYSKVAIIIKQKKPEYFSLAILEKYFA